MAVRKIVAPLSKYVGQKNLVKWTGRTLIFPFYHAVSDQDLPYISNLYPLRSEREFRRDLDYLLKHYRPISIGEVQSIIEDKGKIRKPAFHLTFDDGLSQVYDVIVPILEENGISATFFINTDFIDNKKLFYRYKIGLLIDALKRSGAARKRQEVMDLLKRESRWNDDLVKSLKNLNYHDQALIEELADELNLDFKHWLLDNQPYLSSIQIEDLIKRGFTIGSHSRNHPRFKNIDLAQQKEQIKISFEHLEENFEIKDRYFSFPFGDEEVTKELFDWMYAEMNCKLSFGVSGLKDDYHSRHIHRIPMDNCRIEPQNFIKTEYLYYILKRPFNRNQIKRN